MIALVGSLEVIKYKDDGDDDNTVHMDFMFMCCRHPSINSYII